MGRAGTPLGNVAQTGSRSSGETHPSASHKCTPTRLYSEPMDIHFDYLRPPDVEPALLSECADEVARVLPRPEQVSIVITGDFGRSVGERLDDPVYAAHYAPERITGLAVAKAIPGQHGETVLVVDGRALLAGAFYGDEFDVRRLFAHEGRHILVSQHDEETSDIRLRAAEAGPVALDLLAIAGIASGEYRVELALCREGRWPDKGYIETIPDVLAGFRESLRGAVRLKYWGEPIDRTYRTAVSTFSQIVTQLAYVAAEAEALGTEQTLQHAFADQNWQRLVGPHWASFWKALRQFPSADERCQRDVLDRHVAGLSLVLNAWLNHIGFSYYDLDEGGAYFDVLRHDF